MNCFDELFLNDALRQTYHVLNLTIQHAKENNKKIYLAFSGGKDSLVLNHIVKNYFAIMGQEYILSHNMTGIDEKETYQFLIKNYNWNGREKNSDKQTLVIAPPRERFFVGLKIKKILPTFSARWCCDTCKHKNNSVNEKNNIVFMGIRAAESRARKKRYDWFNQDTSKGNKRYKCIMDIDPKNPSLKVNPILHWTTSDIWNYIELNKIETEGYKNKSDRKGCYLCPLMKIKDLFRQWNSDIPFVKAYKKIAQEILDGKHGSHKMPWKITDIWASLVWFVNISKLNKKHRVIDKENFERLEKAAIERKKQKPKDRDTDENSYLNYYYYYYYYEEELKKDPWYLIRNEKWFKAVTELEKAKSN